MHFIIYILFVILMILFLFSMITMQNYDNMIYCIKEFVIYFKSF